MLIFKDIIILVCSCLIYVNITYIMVMMVFHSIFIISVQIVQNGLVLWAAIKNIWWFSLQAVRSLSKCHFNTLAGLSQAPQLALNVSSFYDNWQRIISWWLREGFKIQKKKFDICQTSSRGVGGLEVKCQTFSRTFLKMLRMV